MSKIKQFPKLLGDICLLSNLNTSSCLSLISIYLCDFHGFLGGKIVRCYIDNDFVQSSDLVDGNFVHSSNLAGSSAADLGDI